MIFERKANDATDIPTCSAHAGEYYGTLMASWLACMPYKTLTEPALFFLHHLSLASHLAAARRAPSAPHQTRAGRSASHRVALWRGSTSAAAARATARRRRLAELGVGVPRPEYHAGRQHLLRARAALVCQAVGDAHNAARRPDQRGLLGVLVRCKTKSTSSTPRSACRRAAGRRQAHPSRLQRRSCSRRSPRAQGPGAGLRASQPQIL